MPRQRAHVADIQHGSESDVALDGQAVVHRRRDLALRIDADDVIRELISGRAVQGCERAVVDGWRLHDWRLRDERRENLALRLAVIEYAEATTHRRLAVAENIPGEAGARRVMHAPVLVQGARDDAARLDHAVGEVAGAGRKRPDQDRRQHLAGCRMDADAPIALTLRLYQLHLPRRIERP